MFRKKEDGVMPQNEFNKEGGEKDRNRVIAQWRRDAEELKHLYPDFDLNEAIAMPEFYEALAEGKSVFEAYSIIMKESAPKPKEERREIYQNGQRARRGTGGSVMNPSKMSREDFNKYIRRIKEGL